MSNTDTTITLAGQFAPLSPRELKLVELAGKIMIDLVGGGVKPTVAQWNTRIAAAVALYPPQCARNMQAQRAALYWQEAVLNVASGLAVAGKSNSQILNITSYLQGLDDKTLDALSLSLEGRACMVQITQVLT